MSYNYEEDDFAPRRKQRRGHTPIWARLNMIGSVLLLIGFLCVVGVLFVPVWHKQNDMRQSLNALEQSRNLKTAELRKSQQQLDLLRSDPEYLETIARDRLNLMKPGETVFRVELPIASSAQH